MTDVRRKGIIEYVLTITVDLTNVDFAEGDLSPNATVDDQASTLAELFVSEYPWLRIAWALHPEYERNALLTFTGSRGDLEMIARDHAPEEIPTLIVVRP